MNPVITGLLSAFMYGTGDFLAGLASRRDAPLRIVALTHPPTAVVLALLALGLGQPIPPASDLWWGALAGMVGLGSILLFYRALSMGPMGAVSVGAGALSAIVPVVVGLLRGETLTVLGWWGALGVLVGTILLSANPSQQARGAAANGVLLGLLAGVGFGLYYVILGQAQDEAGILWTLAAARLCSSLVVVPLAARLVGLRPHSLGLMMASAPGDTLGNFFYLLSVQGGGLALSGLLTSLYPALTTLLAVAILREHLSKAQWVGVVVALVGAVGLAQR